MHAMLHRTHTLARVSARSRTVLHCHRTQVANSAAMLQRRRNLPMWCDVVTQHRMLPCLTAGVCTACMHANLHKVATTVLTALLPPTQQLFKRYPRVCFVVTQHRVILAHSCVHSIRVWHAAPHTLAIASAKSRAVLHRHSTQILQRQAP